MAVFRTPTASERVRERLRQLAADQPRGFKLRIARALRVAPSTVTPWVSGDREPDLDSLETICELANVRLAELVAPEGDVIKQLDAEESAVLRYLRMWPRTVSLALLSFLRFFADEDPTAQTLRNLHEVVRHLDQRQREAVYGYAVMQREGAIPPDIAATLFDRLSVESRAALENLGKKPPKGKRREP